MDVIQAMGWVALFAIFGLIAFGIPLLLIVSANNFNDFCKTNGYSYGEIVTAKESFCIKELPDNFIKSSQEDHCF